MDPGSACPNLRVALSLGIHVAPEETGGMAYELRALDHPGRRIISPDGGP